MIANKPKCKFCQLPEGIVGRNGKPVHTNRDQLCAPCYSVLEKVKREPDKVSEEDMAWFVDMCEFNFKYGMFVPVAQRRELRAKLVDANKDKCKECGRLMGAGPPATVWRDKSYTHYCTACAEEKRALRNRPTSRRPRKDKGKNGKLIVR